MRNICERAITGWGESIGLPPSACERLSSGWRINSYRKGDALFLQSDFPTGVYFLCRGRVALVRDTEGGSPEVLRVVEGPDILGDRALIAGRTYAATAEVLEDSLICVLEGRRFFDLWRAEPEVARAFVRSLARKLDAGDWGADASAPSRHSRAHCGQLCSLAAEARI